MNRQKILPPVIFFSALLLFWQIICTFFSISEFILPAPIAIVEAFLDQLPTMGAHIAVTLTIACVGFGLSIVLALLLAVLLDTVAPLKRALYPFFVVSQTIPIVFIYPLFMIWLGFGVEAKIFVVILVCFFPIVVNLLDGLSSCDPELLDLFRSMNGRFFRTFTMVKLPGALPAFFSGLRISATYSIMGAVIGEWLGASKGMGVYMMRSYKTFSTPRVFAAILVVVLLSLGVFYLVRLAERIVVRWKFIS